MITTNYDIMFSVQEDNVFEGDEGFILYFEFNEVSIDAEDFSRLETGTRAILVTITDNDQCKVYNFLTLCRDQYFTLNVCTLSCSDSELCGDRGW